MTQNQEVRLVDISGKTTIASAVVEELDFKQRFARSALRGGVLFGVAIVGVFVPFLHFVIVPTFVVVGLVAFFMTIGQDKIVPLVSGDCPSCGTKIEFRKTKFGGIQKDMCPSCRQMLKIEFSA